MALTALSTALTSVEAASALSCSSFAMNAASSLSTAFVLSASESLLIVNCVVETVFMGSAAVTSISAKGLTASFTKMDSAALPAAAAPAAAPATAPAAAVPAAAVCTAPAAAVPAAPAAAAAPATPAPTEAALTESWNSVFMTSSALTSDTPLLTEGSRN